jgi:transcription factor SPT20
MSGPVATARPVQALRLRRESQRPGVARAVTRPSNMEDDSAKADPRRYGMRRLLAGSKIYTLTNGPAYTQDEILARHKGKPPSLRIFLHPKHFRINDSADMLDYSSPMREILEHVKTRTIPHNMAEDFYAAEIPFYDNCLIVELHDFRSSGVKPRDDTNSLGESGKSAFSIHNYNSFITPSPHAPYPTSKADAKPNQTDLQAKDAIVKEDKENMPAPNQNGVSQKQPVKPRIWTRVLFPTPQSHLTDMQLLATTPMPDVAALKRMQAAGRAGGMPPTPMTAVPPTPTFSNGPSPKRQKMVLDDSNIHEFESELYNATCPKLHLEPTKSFAESLALIEAITHPNNKNEAPARKTRKRTTAELQADEAEAAATQRFMLAGDEQQANMATTAAGGDEAAVRTNNTQNFSRLKTLATIKANHEEADRRKKEEDARVAQAKRQAQIEAEAQKRRDMETNRQQAENQERQQLLLRQQAAQQQVLQQNQLQQNEALRAATQAQQMASATAAQMSQTPQSATQPQFSPIVQNGTPMASAPSPRVGGQASHALGGTPMVATASNHAIASPARPPSVVSHQQMARSVSQQQNLSRTGTPQMVQGTPVMNAAMPNRNMTPTPARMSQGSPSMAMTGGTPLMMHTPQPGGQNLTPEQMQHMQNQHMMQQQILQQQRMSQQASASPGMQQQLQQLAIQKAQQQIANSGVPPGQNPQQYQHALARRFFTTLQQQQQQQQQQQAQQQRAMQNMSPQGSQQGMNPSNMNLQQLRQHHQQRKVQLITQYGQQNIPQQELIRLRQLEQAIMSRSQAEQQASQMQLMNNGMPTPMQNPMQQQMANMPNNGAQPNNPMQMQADQQMLQQQRAQQARNQQLMAMRQQAMQQGGQLPQGMMGMNGMQGMNGGQGMQGMQGMNMQQMQQMQQLQGMNMNQMSQQQVQQMMMMRQAQQQAQQRMGQGGDGMGWSG